MLRLYVNFDVSEQLVVAFIAQVVTAFVKQDNELRVRLFRLFFLTAVTHFNRLRRHRLLLPLLLA